MKNEFLKSLFYFTKRDRNAVIILIGFIFIVMLLPTLFPKNEIKPQVDKSLQAQIDSIVHYQQSSINFSNNSYKKYDNKDQSSAIKLKPFRFDPNTLSEEGWLQMGLQERTVQILMNYRNKGGRFRKADDLRKIYSLKEEEANALIPYVSIAGYSEKNEYNNPSEDRIQRKKTYTSININTASEVEWKALPGIGDVLSKRIVKFRNSIGGFTAIDDVKKTYGLSDSTFELIKPYLRFSENEQ